MGANARVVSSRVSILAGWMGNLKKRVFSSLAFGSLVLLIATAAVCIRSFHTCDILNCEEPGENFTIHDYYACRGSLVFVTDIGGIRFVDGAEDEGPVPTARRWSLHQQPAQKEWHDDTTSLLSKLGYYYDEGDAHGVKWTYPLWPVLVLCSLVPGCWLTQTLRNRHRPVNHMCTQCGYDLRATPHRCPECGTDYPTIGTTS